MKRTVCALLLLCMALSLAAGGCISREAAMAQAPGPQETAAATAAAQPALTAASTPAPEPEPTPEPTATPCPHAVWEDGVCRDCGLVCTHETWENGVCALCGLICRHTEHDAETLRCPRCGAVVCHTYYKNVCTLCGEKPVFIGEPLPHELFEPCERQGKVEVIEYSTEAYTTTVDKKPVSYDKKMYVYVPYSYDPEEKYDVLVLMHGVRCTEAYWLKDEQEYEPGEYVPNYTSVYTRDLLDNAMDSGHSRKVIVVCPTFYKDSKDPENYVRKMEQPRFFKELAEDILPLIIEKYSTYAEGGSREEISAARAHFGFAGLSMTGGYLYTGALPDCVDIFGWFGSLSGSDGYTDQIAWALDHEPDVNYPIYYFYNSVGTKDPFYYYLQTGQYKELVGYAKALTDGENAALTEIEGAAHQYNAWAAGLYNFLGVAFSLPDEAPEEPAPTGGTDTK